MTTIPTPKVSKKPFNFINHTVDKKGVRKLLAKIYEEYGAAKTGTLANSLKDLGFKYATLAGVTISIADLSIRIRKKHCLARPKRKLSRPLSGLLEAKSPKWNAIPR